MNTLPIGIEALVGSHLVSDQTPVGGDAIHPRGGDRGGLLRLPLESGETVVAKLWSVRNRKERIKVALRFSNGRREWRMHQFIHAAGVPVPVPLGFGQVRLSNGQLWEAIVIEDLGDTDRGLPHLKKLISARLENEIATFQDELINITTQLVRLGVVDIDHQLNNFVVNRKGRLLRIDFECARRTWNRNSVGRDYAEMIARLLASHVYAVQPDVQRTERFAEGLYSRLDPDPRIRALVSKSVNNKLEYQRLSAGVASIVTLPS